MFHHLFINALIYSILALCIDHAEGKTKLLMRHIDTYDINSLYWKRKEVKRMNGNLLKTNELLEKLDISRATLYRLIDKGLPQIKISHKVVRYDFEEVFQWLKSNR